MTSSHRSERPPQGDRRSAISSTFTGTICPVRDPRVSPSEMEKRRSEVARVTTDSSQNAPLDDIANRRAPDVRHKSLIRRRLRQPASAVNASGICGHSSTRCTQQAKLIVSQRPIRRRAAQDPSMRPRCSCVAALALAACRNGARRRRAG